ncbi:GntR family transcriptional regulator [Pacificibacter maritimus]|nr:GntR family transcriptional regulator [Pacificibacter maritimus]
MDPIPLQTSVTEQTAQRLREAIILGEFPLGTKLSEQKLADQLQVSRSPVREALVLLQTEGLVRVFPKRGTFVFSPDDNLTRDLCEHRTLLETACVALAIERNHARLLKDLKASFTHMQNAVSAENTINYSRGDLAFHRAIIKHSGNSSMIKVYETTIGPIMALRTHLFTITGIQLDRSMEQHQQIIEACAARDVGRAQALCTSHIRHLSDHVFEAQLG